MYIVYVLVWNSLKQVRPLSVCNRRSPCIPYICRRYDSFCQSWTLHQEIHPLITTVYMTVTHSSTVLKAPDARILEVISDNVWYLYVDSK